MIKKIKPIIKKNLGCKLDWGKYYNVPMRISCFKHRYNKGSQRLTILETDLEKLEKIGRIFPTNRSVQTYIKNLIKEHSNVS